MKKLALLLFIPFLAYSGYTQNLSPNFRENIDILHYSINLDITDFQNKRISGHTVIQLSPNDPNVSLIQLELLNMEIDSVFLFKEKVDDFEYTGKLLSIPFDSELSQGKCCTLLTVYYHGQPIQDKRWGGFFFTDSTAYNMGVGMGSDPVSFGRVWFPCIDSFTEKAMYEYNITVPKGFIAVCSGILISETDNVNSTVTFKWKLNHEIPTYLASVAVAKYERIEEVYSGIKKEIPMLLYMFPADVANARFSFQNLSKAMRSFENRFGEYVWDRVGYVEVPFGSGAMEHACNIAYPDYAVDSTLFRETLMAHELSHSWFGNLVTCETPGDMWFNEGLTSYSEAIFLEDVYGKSAYKEHVRENHVNVLSMTHLYDNGYRALYGVPLEYTYGSTVYDKGADVSHTLRWYMGDSLFFSSLKALFETHRFKTVSTYEFRDFLSANSGINLNPFFDSWVFTEGFPHFSIDKFETEKLGNDYRLNVSVRQRLKERTFYGNDNLIDLVCVDDQLNFHTERISMSGTDQYFSLILPFKPLNVFLDLEEKISDASVDNYKIFNDTASHDFPYTDFSVIIKSMKGKAIIQSVMNFVDIKSSENPDYTVSKEKYWEIRGCATGSINSEGTFFVSMPENNLNAGFEDVVLLFRKDNDSEFKPIKVDKIIHNEYEGVLIVKNLQFGQYIVATKN
jgi:aminopeptidase N